MGTYLDVVAGVPTQQLAKSTSAGAADALKIISLDSSGRISQTMMPAGIGADIKELVASEAVSQGDLVNVWVDGGTTSVRKADASTTNKYQATGFVLEGYASGVNAEVYFEGIITGLSGLTPGQTVYLLDTAGTLGHVAPSSSGDIVQRVGVAISATEVSFEPAQPITLA